MSRLVKLLLCGLIMGSWSLALGADALSEQKKAQNKLLAYRAARADAIRKLAERINGLHITSETTVKDFVTLNDTIRTAMTSFLSGMKEVGPPKYMEDGTCEVKMEVTLADLVVALEQMHKAYYKGDKIKIEDFRKMTVTNELKVISETGNGAPRPETDASEIVPIKAGESLESMSGMSAKAKAYWMEHVTGQGRLLAVRAARVDGLRRLGERIKGVMITSNTTVRDFVTQSDDVNVDMKTFLVGAKESGVRYHDDEMIVEVEMEVLLRTVYATLKTWGETHYKGDKVVMQSFEKLEIEAKDSVVKETGSGIPREDTLKGLEVKEVALLARAAKAPDWISQTMRATGSAALDPANENKAQAKLMAFRGAELDARRKLAEQIDGLMITSNTAVKDFVTQNDEIRTAMLTFQQGAHVVEGSQKLAEDGTATVIVEIDLRPLWTTIMYYEKKLSITLK